MEIAEDFTIVANRENCVSLVSKITMHDFEQYTGVLHMCVITVFYGLNSEFIERHSVSSLDFTPYEKNFENSRIAF